MGQSPKVTYRSSSRITQPADSREVCVYSYIETRSRLGLDSNINSERFSLPILTYPFVARNNISRAVGIYASGDGPGPI